jgi:hypothetical protein
MTPIPTFSDAPFDPPTTAQYEVISMKRQMWAIDGDVKGTAVFYTEPETKLNVIEGFRCERCNRTFFASELNDFSHECMEAA